MENHVKISYTVLYNQVLSCLDVENHVKISFIVLYNQVLNRLETENHVKISFSRFVKNSVPRFKTWCNATMFRAALKWKIMSNNLFLSALQPCFEQL